MKMKLLGPLSAPAIGKRSVQDATSLQYQKFSALMIRVDLMVNLKYAMYAREIKVIKIRDIDKNLLLHSIMFFNQ